MKTIYTDKAPPPAGHYVQATVHNGLVFVSGQLPIRPGEGPKAPGSIEEQTTRALKNVAAVLAAAGGALGPGIARLLEQSISVGGHHEASHAGLAALIPYLGTGAAVAGILIAWLAYQRRVFRPEAIRKAAGPLVTRPSSS